MAKNSTPGTKNEAASEARARAQAQIRAKERRTTVGIWLAVVVVIALFAVLVAFIVGQSQAPTLGESSDAVPAGSTESGGFPIGTTGVVGVDVPEDALEVRVYADYMCGACARFELGAAKELNALREAGTIEFSHHPIAILDQGSPTQYSTRAASAVAAVADGSPEHVLEYSHLLFENQPTSVDGQWTDAELAAFAAEVGAPTEVGEAIEDGVFRRWVGAASEQASVDGLQFTPTVMVDGEILDPEQVPYFDEGVLREYIEARVAEQ